MRGIKGRWVAEKDRVREREIEREIERERERQEPHRV